MDNLTHSLTGLVLARAGLRRLSPGATLALVLASNVPDVDVLAGLHGTTAYLQHHRGLTHSLLGLPVLALTLAGVLRLTVGGARLGPLLACSLLGALVHVGMDLWTTYGTRVLAPFDSTWYSLDLVFIVDPVILILLLLAVLVPRSRALAPRAASVALGLVAAYVGGRAVVHAQAVDAVTAAVPRGPLLRAAALPTWDPIRWRVLADTPGAYWVGELHMGRGLGPLAPRIKPTENAVVARVRASSEVAAIFLDFSRYPLLEVRETPEGTSVSWRDLRFERPGGEAFVARVVVGHDGGIRREAFRF